jgi:uncharacterized phage infection (PIP) family protein YhgE
MNKSIIICLTPEQEEFQHKRAELLQLDREVAQLELQLATLRGELHHFQLQYYREVGSLYIELDEIEAQIAELIALLNPLDEEAQKRAKQARIRVQVSQRTSQFLANHAQERKRKDFKSSGSLKELYRQIAKLIHPDLTTDIQESEYRIQIMIEVNQAYDQGDEIKLRRLLRHILTGSRFMEEEEDITQEIAQIKERMKSIQAEMTKIKKQSLYQLRERVLQARQEGKDLLAEMTTKLQEKLQEATQRLARLKTEAQQRGELV